MELVKNIFFNTDKLTPNSIVKISYTGKFFQNNSEKVFIRYGFDEDWKNLSEEEMKLSELGFQIEIKLLDNNTFNFCLKNDKNEWDNNNGKNYVFTIERPETAIMVVDNDEFGLMKARHLRKSYIISKKIRIAIYKILTTIPKLVTGNYKKKKNNSENQ